MTKNQNHKLGRKTGETTTMNQKRLGDRFLDSNMKQTAKLCSRKTHKSWRLFIRKFFLCRNSSTFRSGLQFANNYKVQCGLIDGTLDITGLVLWPGAEVLANYIVQHRDLFEGKDVLELGSGTGN